MQVKYPIIIENLYAIYNWENPDRFVAIRNFNYQFMSSKIYCIIGESGSGKSTLISYFNGLTRPIYGNITINGIDVKGRRSIGQLFIAKYALENPNILKKLLLKNGVWFDLKKDYYVVQVPADAKDADIDTFLKIFNHNQISEFYRLNKICLQTLKINLNIRNHFYLVASNHQLDDVRTLENPKNFTQQYQKCQLTKWHESHKIKNFKEITKNVGMVFQFPEYQLFKNTVLDDAMFGPYNLGFKKEAANEAAKKTLLELKIDASLFNHSPFGLSGGQKRRVAIAGILAINGDILVFDEPTAGLDPAGELEMIEIILRAKAQKKTIFIVTHSMDQVLSLADEVLVLRKGKLYAAGEPYKIFMNDEVLDKCGITIPHVIQIVKKLIAKNEKYKILLEHKPLTVEALGQALLQLDNGSLKKGGKIV